MRKTHNVEIHISLREILQPLVEAMNKDGDLSDVTMTITPPFGEQSQTFKVPFRDLINFGHIKGKIQKTDYNSDDTEAAMSGAAEVARNIALQL